MDVPGQGILRQWDAPAEAVGEVMRHGVYLALREHKLKGVPAATWDWENNRVILVPPERIPLPPEYDVEVDSNGNANGSTK
jgi:hypothetical protein